MSTLERLYEANCFVALRTGFLWRENGLTQLFFYLLCDVYHSRVLHSISKVLKIRTIKLYSLIYTPINPTQKQTEWTSHKNMARVELIFHNKTIKIVSFYLKNWRKFLKFLSCSDRGRIRSVDIFDCNKIKTTKLQHEGAGG